MTNQPDAPIVSVLGGSKSDFPFLSKSVDILTDLQIPNELKVVSAHRTPDLLFEYAEKAEDKGIKIIRTDNEENNPMYKININLGFKAEPFGIEYRKKIN